MKLNEKIYFKNSIGTKLCGILSNPTGNLANSIIILCHGFASDKEGTNKSLEIALNKKNISTFRFDFFGHNESEGNFSEITVSQGVDDTLSALQYLKNLGYTKIGLFGGSYAGITSIMTASKTNDLFVLVLKAPVSNYKERDLANKSEQELKNWQEKGYTYYIKQNGEKLKLNYTFFEDYENNNGYEVAKNIKIPTFIIHGDQDKSVPIEQSIKIKSIFPNCELKIIKGADHRFTNPEQFAIMLQLITEFICHNQ